jgi:hypothetical protein
LGKMMSGVRREILVDIVAALREEPALVRELRTLLGAEASEQHVASAQLFMRVPTYAARVSLAERTVWNMVARGLPTIGSGRSRRVDVERADVWLRNERDAVDDVIERSARQSARRAAKAGR